MMPPLCPHQKGLRRKCLIVSYGNVILPRQRLLFLDVPMEAFIHTIFPRRPSKNLNSPSKYIFLGFGVVFLSSTSYAFSGFNSGRTHIRNLGNGSLVHSLLERSGVYDLKSLLKRHLLFSRLADGSVMLYRTDRLPKLPLLCSLQGNHCGSKRIQSIAIDGK